MAPQATSNFCVMFNLDYMDGSLYSVSVSVRVSVEYHKGVSSSSRLLTEVNNREVQESHNCTSESDPRSHNYYCFIKTWHVCFVFRWNFSVGQQDISFLEGVIDEFSKCHVTEDEVFPEWNLRVSIPDGLVAAVQSHGIKGFMSDDVVLWSHKFDSSVAAVWMFSGGHIHPVDLFNKDVMPLINEDSAQPGDLPRKAFMYLGKYQGTICFSVINNNNNKLY